MSAASPDWFPDWSGETVVIVASGPSAKDVPLDLARGRAKIIAINESWRLAPWADALYAADSQWWEKSRGVPEFRGLRVTQGDATPRKYPRIRSISLVRTGKIVRSPKGFLGAGSDSDGHHANSGFQALNLAVQFGTKRIVLVGYDMRIDLGFHWHGRHPDGMNNPRAAGIAVWRKVLDRNATRLSLMGVEVLNASPVSALTAYRKVTLDEALSENTVGAACLPRHSG